jgi:hypothetical protein
VSQPVILLDDGCNHSLIINKNSFILRIDSIKRKRILKQVGVARIGPLAQLVERTTVNREATGSIPVWSASFFILYPSFFNFVSDFQLITPPVPVHSIITLRSLLSSQCTMSDASASRDILQSLFLPKRLARERTHWKKGHRHAGVIQFLTKNNEACCIVSFGLWCFN